MLDDRERKLIDKLPSAARAKLIKIQSELDALHSAARANGERRRNLLEEILVEQSSLDRITKAPPFPTAETDAFVETAEVSIEIKRREIGDLDAADHEASERRNALAQVVKNSLDYLAAIPSDKAPQMVTRPDPTPRKGESLIDAAHRCRARLTELRAELAEVETAPLPSKTAKEIVESDINRVAERGRPNMTAVVENGGAIEWPSKVHRVMGDSGGSVEATDTLALIAYLFRDQLIAAVGREIDAAADDANALSPEDRAAAVSKIEIQVSNIERDEVSFMEQAAAAGITIGYRADVSVVALLNLADELGQAPRQPAAQLLMHGEPRSRHIEVPLHRPALPEHAKRDAVWQ